MNLLAIGSVALDTIITPFGRAENALGGSANYIALSAAKFAPTSVVAVCGEDLTAADKKPLFGPNIDLSGLSVESGKTFRWGGKYDFDMNTRETLFTELGVFENFKPKLSEQHRAAEYVFLGNIHPGLQKNVLAQIKRPKLVGLDTMNYWIENAALDLANVLNEIDVLIINDAEARQLSEEHNLLKAADKILNLMKQTGSATLIIKRGEYGLLMFRSGAIFHLPGYPLKDVADPTGAGDSFAGGFMGFLAKTDDLSLENFKRACVYGSTLASFCVEDFGTKRLQNLTADEVAARYRQFKTLTHFELE